MLDPDFKAHFDRMKAAGVPGIGHGTPEQERALMRQGNRVVDGEGPPDVETRDLMVDGARGKIGARLFTPPGAAGVGPGVVHFHGGGFVIGDVDTYDAFCRRAAKASGMKILSVDYGLCPEVPFPGAHLDCAAAAHWAFDNARALGVDPGRVGVMGDSAGGNLSAATAIAVRDAGRHRFAMQALLYPATGAGETESAKAHKGGYVLDDVAMAFFNRHLALDLAHPEVLRLLVFHTPDLSGLPPAFITTAGFDPLMDDGRLYAEKLNAAGVPATWKNYPGYVHGFYNMSLVSPGVQAAIEDLGAALKERLA